MNDDNPDRQTDPGGLARIVHTTGEPVTAAVIWLHGLGADGNDFVPVVPALQRSAPAGIRFVFPHAPRRPVTINNGMVMRAWYDIVGIDLQSGEDVAGMRDSVALVDALVDEQVDAGVRRDRVFLAGFSQGGVIALRAGLGGEAPLGGVIALSCYLGDGEHFDDWRGAGAGVTPVFCGHGRLDPMIPVRLGRAAAERLRGVGLAVAWHEYDVEHGVNADEIADIDGWLHERLAAAH